MENVKCRCELFLFDEQGVKISVVRAQRIYNNSKWPNPITVKFLKRLSKFQNQAKP